ncbi:MAG: hypothetical protein Q9208_005176 [Pyrenodesmia sp. 3 TL-2023]
MNLLYNDSSIPVPRILSHSSTRKNPLKCPYILMERIDGMPLHWGWYNNKLDPASLANFREKALGDIANTMVQLNGFNFDKAGALQLSTNRLNMQVSPYRKVDFFDDDILIEESNPRARQSMWSQQGPFLDGEHYFLCSLTKHESIYQACEIQEDYTLQGQQKLLRLLIRWFFEATSEDSYDFVLTHPDLDLQNILVGEDGSLRGIVDWDGAATVPHCIGCEEYPLWLTSDWDPNSWAYDPEKACATDEKAMVMVPDELDHYRAMYAQKIEDALRNHGVLTHPMTKVSGLARSLYIAANHPESLEHNVDMILDKIIHLSEQDNDSSEGTDSDTTTVDDDCKLDEAHDSDDRPLSGHVEQIKLNVFDQNSTEHLSLPAAEQDAAVTSSILPYDDSGVGHKCDPPILTAFTELMPFPEHTSLIVEEQPHLDASSKQDSQPLQPRQSLTLDVEAHKKLFAPIASSFTAMLMLFSYFVSYMGLLQSSDISPLAASAGLLLFSNNRPVACIVAFVLGALAFGGLICQSFKKMRDRKHECNGGFERQTASDAEPLPSTMGSQQSIQSNQKRMPISDQVHFMRDKGDSELEIGEQKSIHDIPVSEHRASLLDLPPDTAQFSVVPASASRVWTPGLPVNQHGVIPSEVFKVTMLVQDRIVYELADEVSDSEDSDTESLHREALREVALKKWAEDPLHDFGWYMPTCIYNALVNKNLDAARTYKLKTGFQRLLASLDDRYAALDVSKFSNP